MKRILKIMALAVLPALSFAQGNGQPDVVHWDFSITKKGSDTWTLKAKATMDRGYHIWALDAGGDGSLIPTSISVEEPEDFSWEGEWKELQKPKEQTYEFIEGAVRYFEGAVTFSRDFKVEKGAILSGTADFQTCNEKMCFPPASEDFSLEVK